MPDSWWQNRLMAMPKRLHGPIIKALKAKQRHPIRETEYAGFPVAIETPKGGVRHWADPNTGEKGTTKMKYDYGYFQDSLGFDGDCVDCFLGPNKDFEYAYVVKQLKPETGKYDETKVMLGWDSAQEAKEAYLEHYNRPGFFGGITPYHKDVLEIALKESKHNPSVIKALLGDG